MPPRPFENDALADSTTSLRGMDVVPPSGERTPLLDVESGSSSLMSNPQGRSQGPRPSKFSAVVLPVVVC